MKAYQIMNNDAMWETLERSASDCYYAIYFVTDNADRLESGVIFEDTLRAQAIMEEVTK